MVSGTGDAALEQARRALAIARDLAAEPDGHAVERAAKRREVRAGRGDLGIAGEAVCQHGDHVVRGRVAVDADHVERVLHVAGERGLQHGGADGAVRREEDEHGRKVRVDHAGALGDAADRAGPAAGGELHGDLLRVRVGGHDALSRLIGVVAERGGELRQAGADGREIERLADHARGRDDDVLRRDVQLRRRERAHLLGDGDAVSVAGVGVAAVADHGLGLAVSQVRLRHGQGRALDEVRCIDRRGAGRDGAVDEREVALGLISADAAVDACGGKTLCGAHAAGDLLHRSFLLTDRGRSPFPCP